MINPAPIFTQLVGNAFFGKMVYGLASKIAGRFNYAVRQTLKHHALVEMASKEGVELAGPLTAESKKMAYKNARNQYREIVSNYRRFQRDARSFANQMSPLNPRASRALGRIFSGGQNTRLGTVIGEHIKNEIATMPIMYGMYRYEKSRYPEMRDTNFGKYYAEYLPSSLAFTAGSGAFKYIGRQVNRNLRARVIESGHGQKIVAGSLRAMNAVSRKLGESVYYASKMKQEVFKDRHWRDFMSIRGIRSRLKGIATAHVHARATKQSAFSEDHHMFGSAMSDVGARPNSAGISGAFGPHLEDKYRDLMGRDTGPMKWLNSLLPQSQRAFGMGVRNAHLDYAFRRSESNQALYQTQMLPRDRGLVELGHGGQVYDIRAFHLGKMRDAAASFLENLSFKIPGYREPLHPFQIMTGGANFLRSQMSRSMRMYKVGGPGVTVQGSQFVMKHLIQDKFKDVDGITEIKDIKDANEIALGQLLGHRPVDDNGKTLKEHGSDFLHSLYAAHKTTRGPGGEMPIISKDYGMDPRFLKQTFRNLQQGIIPVHEGSVFFVGKDGYGHLLTGQNSHPYKLAGAGEVSFATEMNKSSMADITARMTGSYTALDEEGRSYRVGRDHSRPLRREELIRRGLANGYSVEESYSYADHLREKWEIGGGGIQSIFTTARGFYEKWKNPRFIKNWFTKEGKEALFSLKQAKDPQSHKGIVTVFNESLNNADKELFSMVTQSGKHYKSYIDAFEESTLKLRGHSYGSLSLRGATGIEDVLHRLNKAEEVALHNKSNSMMGIISTVRDKIKTQNPGDVHALLNKPGKSYYSTLGDDYEATLFHNFVSRAAKSTGGVEAGTLTGIQVSENTLEKLGFLKPAEMSAYGKIMRAQSDLHKVRAMSSVAGKEDYTGYMNTVDSMITNLIHNVNPAEQEVIEKTLSGGNTWFTSMGISKHRYGSFNTDTMFAVGKRGGYTSSTRYRYTEDAQYDSEIHNYTGMGHHFMFAGLNTFNKAMGLLGLGVEKYSSASELATKWITKRILPIGGLIAGVTAADKIIDNSTLFENTPLKEGLFMVPMNAYAGMRLGAQGIMDTTGITGVAKYMEDLFPGSINSAGSGLLRGIAPIVIGATKGFAAGGARGGLKGGVIGGAVGMLLGGGPLGMFGDWDISKDRAELVAQYKGEKEVEIRSGRFWELGSGNYWGEKTCLHPDTLIITRNRGEVKVKDIIEGDEVYNQHGHWTRVIATTFRDQDETDQSFQISTKLDYRPTILTGNHPILIIRTVECSPVTLIDRCKPYKMSYCKNKCKTQHWKSYSPIFIRADELNPETDLIVSRIKENEQEPLIINTYELLNSVGLRVHTFNGYTRKGRWIDNSHRHPRFREDKAKKYSSNTNRLPELLTVDSELAYIMGLYLAEGSSTSNTLQFALHIDETNTLAARVLAYFQPLGITVSVSQTSINGISVTVYSSMWRHLLTTLIGVGLENKQIPIVIKNSSNEVFNSFITAWCHGDAKCLPNKMHLASANYSLIAEARYEMITRGYPVSINHRKMNDPITGELEVFDCWEMFIGANTMESMGLLSYAKKVCADYGRIGCYTFYRITDYQKSNYCGVVYDIQVEHGESFLTSLGTVHNSYFRPHMYALARSDYKNSPNYKTDMMTELMSYVDPSVYNRKHYWSRPSLEAPGIFSNIPIVGPFINLGNEEMHTDDVESLEATNEAHLAMRSSIFGDSTPTERMARATGMGAGDFQDNAFYADPREGDSLPSRISHGFYNLKEVMGLRGFMTETAQETFTGNTQLFSQQPEIEAPNIGSLGRSFWDMNLGGLGGLSEGIRRIFPRQPKEYELYNPVRNLMPGWMPGRSYFLDLKHGDPYSKIEIGEARLPGESYEALRNITPQTPGEADILGTTADEAVAFYAGDIQALIPRYQWADRVDQKREEIIQTIKATGKLIKEKSMVYDVNKNISASIDATYENDNGDFVPVKFVPYLSKRGSFLSGSTSSLNAYLVLAGQKKGLLVGVDEKGNTTEALVYSDEQRYVNDANKDLEYRKKGYAEMMRRRNAGEPVAPGMYYSMADRLQILGDVAPYSDEYRNTLKIVRAQIKAGQLDDQQMQMYQDTLDQVDKQKKSLNFMETRFLDRGSPLTLDEAREQNRIDNKYSSVEKGLGAAWEYISTMRNPITRKLLGNRSAMQAYKEDIVYGQSFKSWQRPLDSYVSPYMNLMAQETDPIQGGLSGGWGGFILGGPVGGALGAAAGSIWAATGGRIVNNSGWIPDKTRKQREIMQGADAAEYERYRQLDEATGYNEYKFRMRNTQTGALELNQPMTPGRIASVANKTERAYLYDVLGELNSSNVSEYRRLMPKEVVTMTDRGMGLKRDFLPEAMASNYVVDPKDVSNYDLPIEDIVVKTMRNEGLEATDVGLGWQDTKRRMAMMEDMGMSIPEMQTRDLPERKTTARINVWQVKDFLRKILADSRPYITVEQSDGPLQIVIEIV